MTFYPTWHILIAIGTILSAVVETEATISLLYEGHTGVNFTGVNF